MPRQPLSKVRSDAVHDIYLGPAAFDVEPNLARLVMKCIHLWAEIDLDRGGLLGTFIRADIRQTLSMYLALASSGPKIAALRGAANAALSPEENKVFRAVMRFAETVRDREK